MCFFIVVLVMSEAIVDLVQLFVVPSRFVADDHLPSSKDFGIAEYGRHSAGLIYLLAGPDAFVIHQLQTALPLVSLFIRPRKYLRQRRVEIKERGRVSARTTYSPQQTDRLPAP